jgi:hypothetical protein
MDINTTVSQTHILKMKATLETYKQDADFLQTEKNAVTYIVSFVKTLKI